MEKTRKQPSARPAASVTSPAILLLEDDAAILELVRDAIRSQHACAVLTATTLRQARKLLGQGQIILMIADCNLPDGQGGSLIAELRAAHPNASFIAMSGSADAQQTLELIRSGAHDFIAKPFDASQLLGRVDAALNQHRLRERQSQRQAKLRGALRRLNDARKTVSQKVDILCNDLIGAYGELARQFDELRLQQDFRQTVNAAADLEQMLCHTMDWLLKKCGNTNLAIFLSDEDAKYELGAYMKFTTPGEKSLTDALRDGLCDLVVKEGFVNLSASELAALSPAEQTALAGQSVVAINSVYLGESLATIIAFREGEMAFTNDDVAALKGIAPLFATALTTLARRDDEQDSTPDLNDTYRDDTPPRKNKKPTKPDPADWWKRGEDSPY